MTEDVTTEDGTIEDVTTEAVEQRKPEKHKKSRWLWPVGVVATSLAGVAVVAFRGCWHGKMSWPVAMQGYSYQVCLGCGVKRLFDEKTFRAYGPFRYDLSELITLEESRKSKTTITVDVQRPAS